MDREEHLKWCKARALEYVNAGDLDGAFASIASDLGKHPETAGHPGTTLGIMLTANNHLNTQGEMRKFINDFN